MTGYDAWSPAAIAVGGVPIGETLDGFVGLAVGEFGAGRVVFLTDFAPWGDLEASVNLIHPANDNAIVWENMFHYAVPEPSASWLQLVALGTVGLLAGFRSDHIRKR